MWYHLRLLEHCNLACTHCYASKREKSPKMNKGMITHIADQIKEIQSKRKDLAIIYLSGGEPLLHPEFDTILKELSALEHIDRIHILTNGQLVEKKTALFAANKDRLGVQISVDGDKKVNDAIRGQGVYDTAVKALRILKDAHIRHWISYTVSKTNSHCYQNILDLASATHSINNNVTPYTGAVEQMLTYQQWKAFKYNWTQYAAKIDFQRSHGNHSCGFIYQCGSCTAGVTINPDGTLTGCARDNKVLGNYTNINKILSSKVQLMNRTCMRNRWGSIENFALKTTLE